jgi:uncharacterized protein RhaS with RHS repeats
LNPHRATPAGKNGIEPFIDGYVQIIGANKALQKVDPSGFAAFVVIEQNNMVDMAHMDFSKTGNTLSPDNE